MDTLSKFTYDTPIDAVSYLSDLMSQKWTKATVEDSDKVTYKIKKAELLRWLTLDRKCGVVIRYKFNLSGSYWIDTLQILDNGSFYITRRMER